MKGFLTVALLFLGCYALSWAVTVGLLRLIFLCFAWPFDIGLATVIWLVFCLWKLLKYKKTGVR